MVFLCPGEIDLASAHGLVRAFHAERADIDMRQNDGDHRHAGRSVEVLRDLHPVDIREGERKEEQDARYGKRRSPDDDRPENQLLASIDTRPGRMRIARGRTYWRERVGRYG